MPRQAATSAAINLMDLTQAGVVSRTDLGDHVWRSGLRVQLKNDRRA